MVSVRRAAVAGQFYAGDAAELERDVDRLMEQVKTDAPCPKVLVAPHAGYVYSGPVAAEVYARLGRRHRAISRVVILGPSHRVAFRGIATSSAACYETPLGQVPLDRTTVESLQRLPGVHCRDDAHALEHSLEVHLPFLQRRLANFSLVPLVVGDAPPEQVADIIDATWGGPETLLVISSDLSHYLPYDHARQRDAATCGQIESLDPRLTGDQACGCRALNGLLTVLRRRGLTIETVAIANSGDTAGGRDRVVGYGAWVVNERVGRAASAGSRDEAATDALPAHGALGLAQRQQLLHIARSAIAHGLFDRGEFGMPEDHLDDTLRVHRASFVSLYREGGLRGCIGNLAASRPLWTDVAHNADAAAFRDPRFAPLAPSEYRNVELHISVLTPPTPVAVRSREALVELLEPGVHGLILEAGRQRATYLPAVWKSLPDPDRFIGELRAKAGLPRQGWSPDIKASVYTSEEFS